MTLGPCTTQLQPSVDDNSKSTLTACASGTFRVDKKDTSHDFYPPPPRAADTVLILSFLNCTVRTTRLFLSSPFPPHTSRWRSNSFYFSSGVNITQHATPIHAYGCSVSQRSRIHTKFALTNLSALSLLWSSRRRLHFSGCAAESLTASQDAGHSGVHRTLPGLPQYRELAAFMRFEDLPPEMRPMIWRAALNSKRTFTFNYSRCGLRCPTCPASAEALRSEFQPLKLTCYEAYELVSNVPGRTRSTRSYCLLPELPNNERPRGWPGLRRAQTSGRAVTYDKIDARQDIIYLSSTYVKLVAGSLRPRNSSKWWFGGTLQNHPWATRSETRAHFLILTDALMSWSISPGWARASPPTPLKFLSIFGIKILRHVCLRKITILVPKTPDDLKGPFEYDDLDLVRIFDSSTSDR